MHDGEMNEGQYVRELRGKDFLLALTTILSLVGWALILWMSWHG